MDYRDILYTVEGEVGIITLNRPKYRNVQSWRMLDELDAAMSAAATDDSVKVIVVEGAGDHFCAGHDLGTPEQAKAEAARQLPGRGLARYNQVRRYNADQPLRWRNIEKPTIAIVQGYCIYAGWMIASAMDLIFAADDALFLAGQIEYFAIPWDTGPRKAKEILFESRFLTAAEAEATHMVNHVYARADVRREALAYAHRICDNHPMILRMAKLSVNKMLDAQGFANSIESGFHDYMVLTQEIRDYLDSARAERRMPGIELAMRSLHGERDD